MWWILDDHFGLLLLTVGSGSWYGFLFIYFGITPCKLECVTLSLFRHKGERLGPIFLLQINKWEFASVNFKEVCGCFLPCQNICVNGWFENAWLRFLPSNLCSGVCIFFLACIYCWQDEPTRVNVNWCASTGHLHLVAYDSSWDF